MKMINSQRTPREDRLLAVLKENSDRFYIDNDGMIHINWEHPAVRAEVMKHLEQLAHIKPGDTLPG